MTKQDLKKVDICIAFNDATPPDGIGMVARNKPSYYHQTVNLVKSIIVNWDKNKIDVVSICSHKISRSNRR